jgi:hypothetical protein
MLSAADIKIAAEIAARQAAERTELAARHFNESQELIARHRAEMQAAKLPSFEAAERAQRGGPAGSVVPTGSSRGTTAPEPPTVQRIGNMRDLLAAVPMPTKRKGRR